MRRRRRCPRPAAGRLSPLPRPPPPATSIPLRRNTHDPTSASPGGAQAPQKSPERSPRPRFMRPPSRVVTRVRTRGSRCRWRRQVCRGSRAPGRGPASRHREAPAAPPEAHTHPPEPLGVSPPAGPGRRGGGGAGAGALVRGWWGGSGGGEGPGGLCHLRAGGDDDDDFVGTSALDPAPPSRIPAAGAGGGRVPWGWCGQPRPWRDAGPAGAGGRCRPPPSGPPLRGGERQPRPFRSGAGANGRPAAAPLP